jgi:hypothetical protein
VHPAALEAALTAISLPVFLREAARERDARVFWMLLAALQLKLAGSLVRHEVAFRTYKGVADAQGYHGRGARIAQGNWEGTMNPRFSTLIGSNFIRRATGALYRVIGPSRIGGFMAYSWLAFWGLYLFHRAFAVAVPGSDSRRYSRLVLFWPSLLYWPSSIGKDAWMVFSLGTGAYGAARGLAPEPRRVLGADMAGVLLAGRARPHVAALLAASIAGSYLARGRRRRGLVLGAVALGQAIQAARYVRRSGIATDEGLGTAFEETARRTSKLGGSVFTPPIVRSPALLPLVPPTILFRPHPLEAHNPQALVTALEGTALLAISVSRIRNLGGVRRQPYAIFGLAFSTLFCGAFAGVANFGVLARQRVQLLPFYMVLLSVPPPRRRRGFRLRRS